MVAFEGRRRRSESLKRCKLVQSVKLVRFVYFFHSALINQDYLSQRGGDNQQFWSQISLQAAALLASVYNRDSRLPAASLQDGCC